MSPYLSMLVSLAVVIGAIVAVAFVLKRLGLRAPASSRLMRVVSQLPLGAREKVCVIEVDNRWLVLGVTAQQISLIGETPKQEDGPPAPSPAAFAKFLKLAGGRHDDASR